MKRTVFLIFCVITVFIVSTITVSLSIINGDKYLNSFKIISFNNVSTDYHLRFEKVNGAKEYEIIIYNDDNSVFWSQKTSKNDLNIDLNNIETNKNYRLVIFAYNDKGDSVTVNNPYGFSYNEPTFNKNNKIVFIDNEDYYLIIDGDLIKKDYYIEIKNEKNTLKKEIIKSNEYMISKELFTNKKGIYTLNIYDNNTIINSIDIYSNTSPISDLKIVTPNNEETLNYSDVNIFFEGGDNATDYILQIYKGDALLKETTMFNKNAIISQEFFKKGEKYILKIIAKYSDFEDYSKTASIEFTMNNKETLKPSYISKNPFYHNSNTIKLVNPNGSGKIYYTTDGSDPLDNGIEYKDEIKLDSNATIKTIIKDKNKNDSKVATYNINIENKAEYKVFINLTINGSDKSDLLRLEEAIEKRLSNKNVIVLKNDLNKDIYTSISAAKYNNVDCYLSLKTNQSSSNDLFGIETWINNDDSVAYSLANIMHNDLINIYYDAKGNRGIKYSNNSLDELNGSNVPLSILIKLSYFDNEKDYDWFTSNIDKIADSISNSILKYFGLI